MYYSGSKCDNCGAIRGIRSDKKWEEIDGRLIEVKGTVKFKDRHPGEKREIQEKIEKLMMTIGTSLASGPIGELLKIAEEIGHNAMWVYWRLSEDMKAVNVPLLHEIRRQRGYKNGWVFMQTKAIESKLERAEL